ncbi:alpha/beta hydrolase-fold protein [Entomospira nematocerorum]|uniref:Alpha/beta hydrolase n=1 Tax=Entomospira nematocerorum TaxID=2719987 RepID=A0A968GH83_9SPIO|nr:alpha/beta hydrolase-fold protein [Entomospira nematocera]NIZ47106.1 alpha/beta hydrolase [Entomospira nematocera]WDI34349.1 alpha/beta hydrolase-fold protein [Entomospira nematocera]
MKYSYESISISPMPFLRKRNIKIYLPINYNKSRRLFPVIYVHDGQTFIASEEESSLLSQSMISFLQKNEAFIVVTIDSIPEYRFHEYAPFPIEEGAISHVENLDIALDHHRPEGAGYIAWLIQELKPHIDKHYQVNTQKSGILGIGMGALISLYAQLKYPDIFTYSGLINPNYWFSPENLQNFIKRSSMSAKNYIYTTDYTYNLNQTLEDPNGYFMKVSSLLQFKTPSKIHIEAHQKEDQADNTIHAMFDYFSTTL